MKYLKLYEHYKRENIDKVEVYDFLLDSKTSYRFNPYLQQEQYGLNHQSPVNPPLGANSPGFGQGAHVGNWGADYGNPSQGVRGTFGEKGDKTDPNLPLKKKQHDFPNVVYDPTTNSYMTGDEVQEILRLYNVECKQNSEEPQSFETIDSSVIEFIQKYLSEEN